MNVHGVNFFYVFPVNVKVAFTFYMSMFEIYLISTSCFCFGYILNYC